MDKKLFLTALILISLFIIVTNTKILSPARAQELGTLTITATAAGGDTIIAKVTVYNETGYAVKLGSFTGVWSTELKPGTYDVYVYGSYVEHDYVFHSSYLSFTDVVITANQETQITAMFGTLTINATGAAGHRIDVSVYNETECEVVSDSLYYVESWELKPGTYDVNVWDSDTERYINFTDVVVTAEQETQLTADFGISPPEILITAPEDKAYATNHIPLTFTVNETVSWMGYSLDNHVNVTLTGNTTLAGLSGGAHTITVYANDTAGNMGSSITVHFTIDTVFPNVAVLSPQHTTYTDSSVSLSFTVDEAASWIGYSLDGHANVTISGNTTLSGLSDGSHSIIVYAGDAAGNTGASGTISFTIETPEEPPPAEPFPIWIVATVIVIVIAASGAAVYLFKIRKKS